MSAARIEYCDSQAARYHETFDCLQEKDHDGYHRGGVYFSECPTCHALDEHSETCTTLDIMEDQTQPLREVRWSDDGLIEWENVPPHKRAAPERDERIAFTSAIRVALEFLRDTDSPHNERVACATGALQSVEELLEASAGGGTPAPSEREK